MLFGYFGGLAAIMWIFIIPLALFTLLLGNAMLAAGFDGLATWTGSGVLRRVATGLDLLSRGLTLLLAAAILTIAASAVLNGLR